MSKRDAKHGTVTASSGWIQSAGATAIAVAGDLHLHHHEHHHAAPSGADPYRLTAGDYAIHGACRVAVLFWRGAFGLAHAVLLGAAHVTFTVLAGAIWCGGRIGDGLVLIERKSGGARNRLSYVPAFMQRDYDATKALEADNDDHAIEAATADLHGTRRAVPSAVHSRNRC